MDTNHIVLSRRQAGRTKKMIEQANQLGAEILARTEEDKTRLMARGANRVAVAQPPSKIPGSMAQMQQFFQHLNP